MAEDHPAAKFLRQLFGELQDVGGSKGIPADVLAEKVKKNPEVVAQAVWALLEFSKKHTTMYQTALTLAETYAVVHGDDSLKLEVERAVRDAGKEMPEVNVHDPNSKPTDTPAEPLRVLEVPRDDLERGDVYSLVRLLSVERMAVKDRKECLRAMRGAFIMLLPLDDDPREIRDIPVARTYMAKLHDQLPYMPYYLDPRPEAGSFLTFFGTLCDREAWQGNNLNVLHESVVRPLKLSLVAAMGLTRHTGEEAMAVFHQLLTGFADDQKTWIAQQVQQDHGRP